LKFFHIILIKIPEKIQLKIHLNKGWPKFGIELSINKINVDKGNFCFGRDFLAKPNPYEIQIANIGIFTISRVKESDDFSNWR